ncbi:hypothetical protein CLJ1_3771 [Pseudomonas paraeruginosa]|nr:hypothetical protein CLJ1_6213 [Pseudomonas aeruginosa]PTC35757.1 hypothetical protein CLJ1_3771 [Pseudomonas aeruginosa]
MRHQADDPGALQAEAGRQRDRHRARALAQVQRIDSDGRLFQPDLAGAGRLFAGLLQAEDFGPPVCSRVMWLVISSAVFIVPAL